MKTKKLLKSSIKAILIASICLFGVILSTNAATKDLFVWNGSNSDWTSASWTITRGTSPGVGTYPNVTNDSVVISNGGTPTISSGTITVYSVTVSNATGATSGSVLTINSGAILNVTGNGTTTIPTVLLKGGNIVNNGTLNITASATGAGNGILCTTPAVAPSSATIYSYSGAGSLSINTSAGTGSSVLFNGTDANSTYKISFPSSTTLTLKANASALNVSGSTTSPVIISGSGFTLGTSGTGVQAGILLQNGNGTNVTIDSGTTLTLYSLSGNTAKGVYLYFSTGGGSFTNNGNIYGYGTEGAAFLHFANSSGSGTNNLSFANNGVISVNMTATATYAGVMNISTVAANGTNTNSITNTGTMTLVNTQATGTGLGYCLYHGNTTFTSGSLTSTITNSGTFELNGTQTSTGGKASYLTINNNSGGTFILNPPASGSCLDKTIFNNNTRGTLNCKNSAITSNSTYLVSIKAGSTLKTAHTGGLACIGGTLPNGAVLDPAANYVFDGTAAQTTGSTGAAGAALTTNNIIFNNAAGVTLSADITVNGNLSVASGTTVTLGAKNLTINGGGSFDDTTTGVISQNSTGVFTNNSVIVTSLSNFDNRTAKAYTSNGQLMVMCAKEGDVVLVHDISGKTVSKFVLTSSQSLLNLGKGIYFVTLKSEGANQNFKVLVK